jgi:hypothetical protein
MAPLYTCWIQTSSAQNRLCAVGVQCEQKMPSWVVVDDAIAGPYRNENKGEISFLMMAWERRLGAVMRDTA